MGQQLECSHSLPAKTTALPKLPLFALNAFSEMSIMPDSALACPHPLVERQTSGGVLKMSTPPDFTTCR